MYGYCYGKLLGKKSFWVIWKPEGQTVSGRTLRRYGFKYIETIRKDKFSIVDNGKYTVNQLIRAI